MTQHQFQDRTHAERAHQADRAALTRRSVLAFAAGVAAFASAPARSQSYPSRPIRFVIPYAPACSAWARSSLRR